MHTFKSQSRHHIIHDRVIITKKFTVRLHKKGLYIT
jgi:hypothetical protein